MNFMCDETYTYFNEMLFHERKIVILILINECEEVEEKKTVIESKHAAKSNRYFGKTVEVSFVANECSFFSFILKLN